ncbi:metallophosphoesterase family protein [Paenibacillus mendelii]|uniref:Metallophosphoesterase family protein n=1 Tax=Paenibacillus mendelii TaxID=206163 RepID=A0ABV6JL00_9BACL|nr:metallophosphoesterase family protein [Paenibacillus mendelii]MCQ6564096.1 metallophosphatase family protein [Paenibacillus mendelii]
MDRIAIISDIHGNIPALEAVLSDISERGIKRIFCLGDLIGKGPHPKQAIDKIKNSCESVVLGNWDDWLTSRPDEEQEHALWQYQKLDKSEINYLKSLPFSTEFFMSGRYIRLFHASAESLYKRVQPHAPIEDRLAMFNNTEKTGIPHEELTPDVVGYGDIHNAFIQNFKGKVLFNVGSVGNPLEIAQACYTILEGWYGCRSMSAFSIQLVRVPYDIELAIRQAQEENMPLTEQYANELRTAVYRGSKGI